MREVPNEKVVAAYSFKGKVCAFSFTCLSRFLIGTKVGEFFIEYFLSGKVQC